MTETNETQKPDENKPVPVPAEGELRAELDRVRGKNKTLKVVAASLLTLFLIISAVGFFIYRRVSATKAAIEQAFQGFAPVAPGYQPENRLPAAEQGVYGSTSMPASSLGLFSGELPGGGTMPANFNAEQGEQLAKAFNKYADRPLVKAFLADLRKDPEMAAAFSADRKVNPLAFMAAIKNYKGMDRLALKYATKPEFMKLMMEFMNDPEMQPLMKGMPPGMGMPSGLPQGSGLPVPAMRQQPAYQQQEELEQDAPMTFDPSVISGPAKPAPAASKKAPPPVDRE